MIFCPFTNRIPFGLLTDEEKKILKAEGPWEVYDVVNWVERVNPLWSPSATYRRKKMPVIKKITVFGNPVESGYWDEVKVNDACYQDTHKITYNIVDGEVDVFSCVMEKL